MNDENDNVRQHSTQIKNFIKTNGYTIPFLITLSYTVLVAIPLMVEMYCLITDSVSTIKALWKIYDVTWPLNNLSDVLIYVLCDRDIRNHSKKMFISEQDDNSNIQMISSTC